MRELLLAMAIVSCSSNEELSLAGNTEYRVIETTSSHYTIAYGSGESDTIRHWGVKGDTSIVLDVDIDNVFMEVAYMDTCGVGFGMEIELSGYDEYVKYNLGCYGYLDLDNAD